MALSGKASFRTAEASQAFRFRWQQNQGAYDIWLWGALGAGRTQIVGTAESLTITTAPNQTVTGRPSELMEQQLGWSVPLEALGAWLSGSSAQSLPVSARQVDDAGRLLGLTQGGWQVEFANHNRYENQWKPLRITITGADLELDLVISRPRPAMERPTRTKDV